MAKSKQAAQVEIIRPGAALRSLQLFNERVLQLVQTVELGQQHGFEAVQKYLPEQLAAVKEFYQDNG